MAEMINNAGITQAMLEQYLAQLQGNKMPEVATFPGISLDGMTTDNGLSYLNGLPVFNKNDFQQYTTDRSRTDDTGAPIQVDPYWGLAANSPWATNQNSPFAGANAYSGISGRSIEDQFMGATPLTSNNWDIQFNPDGSVASVKEKTGQYKGTVNQYGLSNGQYAPTGASSDVQWKTNASRADTIAMIASALALGGIGASAAAGAGAAGSGVGAGTGGLASAGTPISMVGPEAISASALPELGAGAGGLGAASQAVGGAGAAGGSASGAASSSGLLGQLGSALGGSSGGLSDLLKLGAMGLGAAAGASGAGPQTTTTSQSLPPELQGLLSNLVPKVQQNSNVLNAGTQQLTDTINGKYLSGNPYVEDMVRQQQDQMQNRFGTNMMGSGSFGNANVAQQGFKAMNDSANSLRFNNYSQERQNQMSATNQAPNFNLAPYAPAFSLLGLGGRNTSTTSPGTSTGAGLLGGALMGGQLYNTWFK